MAIFTVDPAYNPERAGRITPATKLAPGITMAKFLGGYGSQTNMNHITDNTDRLNLAKNYAIHAKLMRHVISNQAEFNNHRMIVAEGLYVPAEGETPQPGSLTFLKQKGRAVVYELRGINGLISNQKTFDLAKYLKDTTEFDMLSLSYDTFNPDESLTVQLIITTPVIKNGWEVVYKNEIETRFNENVQTQGELTEISL
mgnify:FL=1